MEMMSVCEELNQQTRILQMKYGQEPIGYILGPEEYLKFCEELYSFNEYSSGDKTSFHVIEHNGFPVWQKNQPGAELIISPELSIRILYGT